MSVCSRTQLMLTLCLSSLIWRLDFLGILNTSGSKERIEAQDVEETVESNSCSAASHLASSNVSDKQVTSLEYLEESGMARWLSKKR